MWHAELGQSLIDMWAGKYQRGVQLHDLLTVSLNGAGTIDHVVNDVGDPVTPTVQGPSDVVSYP